MSERPRWNIPVSRRFELRGLIPKLPAWHRRMVRPQIFGGEFQPAGGDIDLDDPCQIGARSGPKFVFTIFGHGNSYKISPNN